MHLKKFIRTEIHLFSTQPAVVVAHVLAILTLVYSLEKSFGVITKAVRIIWPDYATHKWNEKKERKDDSARSGEAGDQEGPQSRILRPRWVRGPDAKVTFSSEQGRAGSN